MPLYWAGLCEAVNIAPGRVEVAGREVDEVGRREAEVGDWGAHCARAFGEGFAECATRRAHVARHEDLGSAREGREGRTHRACDVLVSWSG